MWHGRLTREICFQSTLFLSPTGESHMLLEGQGCELALGKASWDTPQWESLFAGKAFGTNKPPEPPAQELITRPVAKPLALLLQVIVIAMVVRVGEIGTVRTAPATPDINTCLF